MIALQNFVVFCKPQLDMEHALLDEAQAGIKISGRNTNNLRHADDAILMAERGTKKPLDESEIGE